MISRLRQVIFLCIVICLSHVISIAQGQTVNIRPFIIRIAKEIAQYNQIDSQGIGETGIESEQWDRFQRLYRLSTEAELHQLANYPNAVVRCYTFHAIALRNDTTLFSILLGHLKDTAQVKTLDSDLGGWDRVCDYFVDVVTPEYIDLKSYKLNKKQKEKLDSILLYDKSIHSSARNDMLRQLKPNPEYYERVKEIVETENNGDGLIALSKYKNPNDTSLIFSYLKITEHLNNTLCAVRDFPDPIFYPCLVKIFNNEFELREHYDFTLWRMLFEALAQYPTPQTLGLFDKSIREKDEYRRQELGVNLLVALNKYPNPYFENLKAQIKLDEFHREDVSEEMKSNY